MESPTADSTLKVSYSTIADNVADEGAGISGDGNLDLRNSTIARNVATTSGGGVLTDGTGWTLALKNTAIMGNTASGASSDWADEFSGELAANAVHSQVGLSGKTLGYVYFSPVTLADNGGPTLTLKPKLAAGNALIDGGDATVCASEPIKGKDQRGFGRLNPLRHRRGRRRPHEARRVRHLGRAPEGPDPLRYLDAGFGDLELVPTPVLARRATRSSGAWTAARGRRSRPASPRSHTTSRWSRTHD